MIANNIVPDIQYQKHNVLARVADCGSTFPNRIDIASHTPNGTIYVTVTICVDIICTVNCFTPNVPILSDKISQYIHSDLLLHRSHKQKKNDRGQFQ
jgi:hypothetical protein